MKKAGPCKVLKNFDNGNNYDVELSNDRDISLVFNTTDIYGYHELDDEVFVLDNYPKKKIEEVE